VTSLEEGFWGRLSSVELEHLDAVAMRARKVLPTIRELNLSATLDLFELLDFLELLVENVHDLHRLLKADDHMEATGMDGNRKGLFRELLPQLELEGVARGVVGPETHRAIVCTGGHQLLLDAEVQAVDLLRVERRDEVVVGELLVRGLVQVDLDRNNLAGVR